MEYDIEILTHAGGSNIGVEGDFENDAAALNWAYYYLGRYRGDTAMRYRGEHTNPRDPSTLVAEISAAEAARR